MSNGLVYVNNDKKRCQIVAPSSCIPWTGGPLRSFDIKEICDPSVEEVIIRLDTLLYDLEVTLDLSKVDTVCFAPTAKLAWWRMGSLMLKELCDLRGVLDGIQLQIDNINLGNIVLNVDLSCLAGECSKSPLTIKELFELMIRKLCELMTQYSELAPSTSINGNLLYQPSA